MDFETRGTDLWPDVPMEMRATRAGLIVEGYAVPFDKPSRPIPGGPVGHFTETFKAGAFKRSLGLNPDVLMKYQHNHLAFPLGRTSAGTLVLGADTQGLTYRNTLPDNEAGRPVYDAIERRDITGVSITFRIRQPASDMRVYDNESRREVFVAELGREISYVDHPAYPDASAFARSLAAEAGVDEDELVRVFTILHEPDGKLTGPDRDLLMEAINKRTDAPFVGPKVARARERLAALAKPA